MTSMDQEIVHNDVQALQERLSRTPDVANVADNEGYLPLYYACMKDSSIPCTVELLLSCGASVDAKGRDGETALYIAIFHRRLDLASLLHSAGADVNAKNGVTQETALHLAARTGFVDEVRWLLSHGATCNMLNTRRETPLYLAARAGRHESVFVLLQAGADTTLSNVDGKDAPFIASEKEHKAVVVLLKAARSGNLLVAKAEADRIYSSQPHPLPTSEDIVRRASVDDAFAQRVHLASAGSRQTGSVPNTPIEVMSIVVPQPKHPTVDPLTGKMIGPCRSLQDVGYETAPPVPRELQERPPATLPRIGGTSMVVGTGTTSGSRVPIRVDDMLLNDTLDFSQSMQH